MSDEAFMELALAQARHAAAWGEVPVGAIVVRNGVVIAVGRNAPIDGTDPTAHAEILALRAAAQALGNYRLDECELFVTLEPCAMCSGAMLAARLKRVVFGASEPKTGAGGSVIDLFANRQLNHQTILQGGVLAEECAGLIKEFFRHRRGEQNDLAKRSHPLRDDALRTPDSAIADLPDYPWTARYLSDLPSLDGLRMHYIDEQREHGEMERDRTPRLTYLCLHDSPAWSYGFRALIGELLQAGHRVVAPDLIGFGKSDKPKKESFHEFGRHRRILVELVEKLDLREIVLVMPGQGTLLGLSLPMAAAWRYGGLRLMNGAQTTADVDLTLSEGLRLLQAVCNGFSGSGSASIGTPGGWPAGAGTDAALDAPFPSRGYRAGVRAFSAAPMRRGWNQDDVSQKDLERFWREYQAP